MCMKTFRSRFPNAGIINWYPGHMATAKRQIQEQIASVDAVVEVRDARIPFSSANPLLDEVCKYKKRLIVFNKADLANPNMQSRIQESMRKNDNLPCLFTSATKGNHIAHIEKWCIQNATSQFKISGGTIILVAGVPNVGKSSIINGLRKISSTKKIAGSKRAAAVGDMPGVTRRTDLIKINQRPATFIIDTPGIMLPKITDTEVGLRLALTGAIKDTVVGYDLLLNYMLHVLNNTPKKMYIEKLGLESPLSSADDLVEILRERDHKFKGKSIEDQDEYISKEILKEFRKGSYGLLTLDPLKI